MRRVSQPNPDAAHGGDGLGGNLGCHLDAVRHGCSDCHRGLRIDPRHAIGHDREETSIVMRLDGALRGVAEAERPAPPQRLEHDFAAHQPPPPGAGAVGSPSSDAPVNWTLSVVCISCPTCIGRDRLLM